MTITEWMRVVHENATRHGFHKVSNIWTMLGNLHAEISEAWEEARHPHFDPKLIYSLERGKRVLFVYGRKPEGLPIELADVALRLFDLAEDMGIDLEEAIALKHDYNLTRPHMHGGKRV